MYWCFTREERKLTRYFVFRSSEKGSGPEVPREYRYKDALEEEVWIMVTVGNYSFTLPRPIHLYGREGDAKADASGKGKGKKMLPRGAGGEQFICRVWC